MSEADPVGESAARRRPKRAQAHPKKRRTTERGLGWDWQRFREAELRRRGWRCQRCQTVGRVTVATELHHLQPRHLRPDLRLDPANVLAVCRPCHLALEAQMIHENLELTQKQIRQLTWLQENGRGGEANRALRLISQAKALLDAADQAQTEPRE